MKYENTLTNIADTIGYNGPNILKWVNLFFLIKTPKVLVIYIIFAFFIVYWINTVFKNIIKEPRPTPISPNHKNQHLPTTKWGMPSNYAQITSFITVFSWMITKNVNLLFFNLFIYTLSVSYKFNMGYHSFKQLAVGTILGTLIAFFVIFIIKKEFTNLHI